MNPDEIKALERRFFDEMLNEGRTDVGSELFDVDALDHAGFPGQVGGREGFEQAVRMMHAAFPDIHYTIEDMIVEDDRIATRWTLEGTHEGEFLGVPATGRKVAVEGIHILRFADRKIVECWETWDRMSMLRQLGVLPEPALSPA